MRGSISYKQPSTKRGEARSSGLDTSDVDDAMSAKRSLVTTWLNRGTLHLVTAQDYWWLHPLTTPQLATGNNRRLRQEGVSKARAERGVAIVVEVLRIREVVGPRSPKM